MAPKPKMGLGLLVTPEDDGQSPEELSAAGILEAIQADDAVELAAALKAFIQSTREED